MTKSLRVRTSVFTLPLFVFVGLMLAGQAHAITSIASPYVTQQTNVPLNQSTNDSINGVLPYFNSDTPPESGSVAWLVNADSTNTPVENVILGPDDTWVGVAWDFGDPGTGFVWQLDRVDLWINAGDDLRRGIHTDLSISSSGAPADFTVITNSEHWDALTQNNQYNYVRYDFPNQFVAGATTDKDKYFVRGFRYLRLNSRGHNVNDAGTDWQTRFTEMDAWVSKIAVPPPNITSVTRNSGGDITLVWTTLAGRTYLAEYKATLSDSDWSPLQTVVADASNESVVDLATQGVQRYYRITLQP